jgi:myo-inositol-1(or 4)-monophosphatase
VIYDVAKDELYWAEKGQGAFLNDKRLRVAARANLGDAVFAAGLPHLGRANPALMFAEIQHVTPHVAAVRTCGSAALDLAYVAAGRFDGYWDRGLGSWDIAAGAVLVREAGGFAREIDGKDFMTTGSVIAANDKLFPQLQKLLKGSTVDGVRG